MDYKEFVDYIINKIKEELCDEGENVSFYPKGFTSADTETLKQIIDSNLRFTGKEDTVLLTDCLIIKQKDNNGELNTKCVSTEKLYEEAQKSELESIISKVRQMQNMADETPKDTYERIKSKLILRPLNYQLHIRELKGCVYQKIGDFVLVLYQYVRDADKVLTTRKILRDELKEWGMQDNPEQVMKDALENSARLFPACAFDYSTYQEVDFLTGNFSRQDITMRGNHFIISTFKTVNGALSLFYPGVAEKLMKLMNGAFVAVFMNINDVMIFDLDDPLSKQYVKTAETSSKMGEMLSKRRYRCDENGIHVL